VRNEKLFEAMKRHFGAIKADYYLKRLTSFLKFSETGSFLISVLPIDLKTSTSIS
jgi:hypothetical protein